MNGDRYFLCSKCGGSFRITTDGKEPTDMCLNSMPVRTSGICGGSFTIELEVISKHKKKFNDVMKLAVYNALLAKDNLTDIEANILYEVSKSKVVQDILNIYNI